MRASIRAAAAAVAAVLVVFATATAAPAASLLWRKQPGSLGSDEVRFVRGDAAGNVVMAYQSYAAPNYVTAVYAIIKYDPAGKQLWRINPVEQPLGLALDPSGNVYALLGGSFGSPNPKIVKYTSDGALLWKTNS